MQFDVQQAEFVLLVEVCLHEDNGRPEARPTPRRWRISPAVWSSSK
jgi:hypothetical protein